MSSNHNQQIPFVNQIMAILLTVVFIVTLFFAFFSLPVELVFFNPNQYLALLNQEEYVTILPEIVSDLVINQMIPASPVIQYHSRIFQNEVIESIIEDTLPEEWVQSVFSSSLTQIFDFINFRTPLMAIEIELGSLKNHYSTNSNVVAERIVESLPNCGMEDLELFSSAGTDLQIDSLPVCRPPDIFVKSVTQIIQSIFKDSINQIPDTVKISGILPVDNEKQETLFFRYSLLRWGLRLLPIFAIVLFIAIAVLLKQNRSTMLRWCGKTLIFVSVLTLILLTLLLIGFDQFIAIMINKYLANVIPEFGNLLLKMAQDIGYQTLLWVIVSVVVVLGFGVILQFSAKLFKQKIKETEISQSMETEANTELSGEDASQHYDKEILPDTLEEIEKKEKKTKK